MKYYLKLYKSKNFEKFNFSKSMKNTLLIIIIKNFIKIIKIKKMYNIKNL